MKGLKNKKFGEAVDAVDSAIGDISNEVEQE